MRTSKKHLASVICALVLAFTMCVPALAFGYGVVRLGANQAWTSGYEDTRSGDKDYASAECESVYPSSGIDLFSKIQCRIRNDWMNIMSVEEYVVLTEGEGHTTIALKEGYLERLNINFQFRGNSNAAASAAVQYDAK